MFGKQLFDDSQPLFLHPELRPEFEGHCDQVIYCRIVEKCGLWCRNRWLALSHAMSITEETSADILRFSCSPG